MQAYGRKKVKGPRPPARLQLFVQGATVGKILSMSETSGRTVEEIVDMAVALFELATRDVKLIQGYERARKKERAASAGRPRPDRPAPGSVGRIMEDLPWLTGGRRR